MYREYLLTLPVQRFKLMQESLDSIVLYFTGDPAIAESQLIRGLCSKVQELHGGACVLRLCHVERFPSVRKFEAFVTLVDQADAEKHRADLESRQGRQG
jgi:hypothetical protein